MYWQPLAKTEHSTIQRRLWRAGTGVELEGCYQDAGYGQSLDASQSTCKPEAVCCEYRGHVTDLLLILVLLPSTVCHSNSGTHVRLISPARRALGKYPIMYRVEKLRDGKSYVTRYE